MPTLQPGSTSQAFDVDIGQTVSVTPGSGGTMLVEYTTNSETDIRNGSATWQAWTAGTVSTATSDVAMFPLFARVTAYTAGGSYELSGSGLRAVPNQYVPWKKDVVSARNPASAAAAVGAIMSNQSYVSFLSMIGEDQMDIVSTYTSLPSAAQNYRRTYFVTDQSAAYISDGLNWLPLHDRTLDELGSTTPPTMSGTSEVILRQFVIPAPCWRNFQEMWLNMTLKKSGMSENFTGRVRLGTTGTLSDTLIAQNTALGGTSDAGGILLPFKRISATSIQKLGNGSFGGSMTGGSSTDVDNAVTVANLDSNAVTVTLSALSSAAAETLSLIAFRALLTK